MQRDYLIVGQGIVGSVLALSLLRKGRTVMVIDQPQLSSSSRVAAGVYNPFNFRQLMNNWRAAEMVNAAEDLYRYAESVSGQSIFSERKIWKVLSSADERRLWERACAEKEELFADEKIMENPFGDALIAPFGIGIVNRAGNIDTNGLLQLVRQKLEAQNDLLEEKFDPEKLQLTKDGVVYENVTAKQLIFCEGHLGTKNPWFDFVRLKPVKGQVLHIRIPGFPLTEVLNRGIYLLPLGNEHFILGSTFENFYDDELPDKRAEEDLLGKLQKFLTLPVYVEARFAGIRPAVEDRRPLVGRHPQFPQLAMINGMGSKGVLLSPWLSEKLIENIEQGTALPAEVALLRYVKKGREFGVGSPEKN